MDCDLLMYLRAARSMAAFVGWCDGGSTDDGCAAASMDETTINALHTLHQNSYDTGKALQAFVKIINPKSVDKRWPDEDTKKFVRGLKQHGKNFFKIRKELLPYKDTANLVEYYYLWKKTPAASTTRPHRRHRRPAFRRQAPTPTLPAGDEMEDMSSASEASEMESEEDCNQSTVTTTNNHDMTSSCSRCSTTKSSRWYEANKDMVVCADCHHNSEAMIGQADEEAPPNCDLVGGVEDEMTRVVADEDAPPFMFRPVKEENEKMAVDETATNEGKISVPGITSPHMKIETDQIAEDVKVPIAPPVDTKENITNSAVNCTKEEVIIKDESDDAKQGLKSLMSNDGNSSPAQKKAMEQVVKSEKMDITQDEPIENHKWFGFSNNFPPNSAFSSQQSPFNFPPVVPSVTPVSSTGSATSSSLFDVKPQRAVASVAPTFQDVPQAPSMINQQSTITSFQPPSSPMVPASSSLQQNSFRPSSPRNLCPTRLLGSSSASSSFSSSYIQSAIYAPHSSSSSSSSYLPTPSSSSYLSSSYLPHIPTPSSYPPLPIQPSSFSSSSSSTLPEDMTTRSRREPTPTGNQDRLGTGSTSMMGKNPPLQQQPLICHNISDDDDDDDDCNIMRSPSPDVSPCNEQVYSSFNSVFMKKWNRGCNSCSRCDLEFVPNKNSEWAMKKEERSMQKNSSSASNSHHHHNHHKSQHTKSSSSHQSVLKDGRRTDGRKDEDKNKSPMPSRSSDAQITSSLIGGSHHLPPFAGPPDRMSSRGGIFHDPTPALSQLSAYARPHIGNQRCLNYSIPPTHSMEPYVRMPGMYPSGSRDVLEMDMDKHIWDRDQRDRDLRELEFLEKMKQEMELKSAAGFDRMPHLPGASVDPMWAADIQRRIMTSQLALSASAPGHIPGIFPPPGNLSAELMQRERMEQLARSGQDQLAAAVARDTAVMQLYQRYGNDPGLFQRHFDNLVGNKAQESVHLVYHFAKADPLASAVSQASALGGSSSSGLTAGHLPPPPSALHSIPPNHPLFPFARDHERYYMEVLSRPPYSTNPMLAQQAMNNLTAQAAAAVAQQEAIQRQLAMERDFSGNPMLH